MTIRILDGRHIALGVTGSIATYKAVALASALHQAGALVDVAMTPDAQRFVLPLSFQAITHRPVFADLWASEDADGGTQIAHVALGQRSDAVVVAPATAHTLAKLAHGLADDPVSITVLAARGPVIVAPAMDAGMYTHPATIANVATLRSRGVSVVEPESGHLASGLSGLGRLASPHTVMDAVRAALGATGGLMGCNLLVTAGGTQEPIDPVRFISNRSSGKMGFALAEEARDSGAQVTLVATPTTAGLRSPSGVRLLPVERAHEMLVAIEREYADQDALIMAAAVGDFRPEVAYADKVKRGTSDESWSLKLNSNPDILQRTQSLPGRGGPRPVRVGFAAETRDVLENAAAKLAAKELDLIVANDVAQEGSGFATDTNQVTLIWRDGRREALPLMAKSNVAERVLSAVMGLLAQRA